MNTIISCFEQIVNAYPNQAALVADKEQLSYREFDHRAKTIAYMINEWFKKHRGRAVSSIDVIGIALEKNIDLYTTVFAVLGVGASYVPIDPELDIESKKNIIHECKCELFISTTGMLNDCINEIEVLCLSELEQEDEIARLHMSFGAGCIATDIAYTIFTSGSTGRPKGVMVNHANVLNLVNWAKKQFNIDINSKVLQFSTINFDASILDIFPTLLAGATLYIPTKSQRMSITALAELCKKWQINHAFLPPTLLNVLDPVNFPTLSILLTGGESCSPNVIKNWSHGRLFYNLYGPTECTVLACCKLMNSNVNPQNIGIAIDGVRTYILNNNQEIAEEGELYLAGTAVSCGYKNNDLATAERFLKNKKLDASVLYRTGDIVKLDINGDIVFIGRLDRQVKVRGYRIELEEIETALLSVGCKEAAVKLSKKGEIVANVVLNKKISLSELKENLAKCLPSFKLPQYIVPLDYLPHKSNGKIDYQSLLESATIEKFGEFEDSLDEKYALIAKLWSEVLSIDMRTLKPKSNFRDLGGDSIKIATLLVEFEYKFNVLVDYIDFFDTPTIENLFEKL